MAVQQMMRYFTGFENVSAAGTVRKVGESVMIDLMVITEVSQMINKVRRPDCLGSLMSANNLMAFHPRVIVTLLWQNQHCHPEQAYEILYKWLLQSKHT